MAEKILNPKGPNTIGVNINCLQMLQKYTSETLLWAKVVSTHSVTVL